MNKDIPITVRVGDPRPADFAPAFLELLAPEPAPEPLPRLFLLVDNTRPAEDR